jgi:hypothetical protein
MVCKIYGVGRGIAATTMRQKWWRLIGQLEIRQHVGKKTSGESIYIFDLDLAAANE